MLCHGSLSGRRAVVAFDSRQRIDEGWIQALILDDGTPPEARPKLDALFGGDLGGPWATLGRFVSERLPTRYLAVEMETEPTRKRVRIPAVLDSTVEAIRGRDRSVPVRLENIFFKSTRFPRCSFAARRATTTGPSASTTRRPTGSGPSSNGE